MYNELWQLNELDNEIMADILKILHDAHYILTSLIENPEASGMKEYARKRLAKVDRAIGWLTRL